MSDLHTNAPGRIALACGPLIAGLIGGTPRLTQTPAVGSKQAIVSGRAPGERYVELTIANVMQEGSVVASLYVYNKGGTIAFSKSQAFPYQQQAEEVEARVSASISEWVSACAGGLS